MSDRRALTESEREHLLSLYGMRCFITGHPIEGEDDLEFDHIIPVAAGGGTTLDNLWRNQLEFARCRGERLLAPPAHRRMLHIRDGCPYKRIVRGLTDFSIRIPFHLLSKRPKAGAA